MSIGWGCIDGFEVELWGECYNIEETIELDLSYNNITVIPNEIGNLINLISIDLSLNEIEFIPPEIGDLINLEILIMMVKLM